MSKILFSELNRNLQINRCTFPHGVFVTKNPDDETGAQIIERQEKFLILPESIKDKLVSYETSEKIQGIGRMYNLELLQLADISRAIRSFYFGEIQLQDFPQILSKEMNVDFVIAQKISEEIIRKIIKDDSQEKAYQAQLEKLPLAIALEKFPDIGEQLITSDRIKIQGFPEPARPSVKNWLSDYTFNAGYEKHNAMERGNYLFKNINAKILRNAEQKKIAYILKAYDENEEITVNVALKQIVFPRFEIAEKKIPSFAGIGNQFSQRQDKIGKPYTKMTFSSPQKFSFEDRKSTVGKYPNYQPPRTINLQEMRMKKEEKKTIPNNLVNLKEE